MKKTPYKEKRSKELIESNKIVLDMLKKEMKEYNLKGNTGFLETRVIELEK